MNMTYEQYFDLLNTEFNCDMSTIACEAMGIQAELEYASIMYGNVEDYANDALESSNLALTAFEDDYIDGIESADPSQGNQYTVATEAGLIAKIKSGFNKVIEWFKRIGTGIKDWFTKMKDAVKRKIEKIQQKRKAAKMAKDIVDVGALIEARDAKIAELQRKKAAIEQKLSGSTLGGQTKKANKTLAEAKVLPDPNGGEEIAGKSQEKLRRELEAIDKEIKKVQDSFNEGALKKGEQIGKNAAKNYNVQLERLAKIVKTAIKADENLCLIERKILELGADEHGNSSLRNWSGLRGEREKAGDLYLGDKGIREKGMVNGTETDANYKTRTVGDNGAARKILIENSDKLKGIGSSAEGILKHIEGLDQEVADIQDKMQAIGQSINKLDDFGHGAEGNGYTVVRTCAWAAFNRETDAGNTNLEKQATIVNDIATNCDRMVKECQALNTLVSEGKNAQTASKAISAVQKAASNLQHLCGVLTGSASCINSGIDATMNIMGMTDRLMISTTGEARAAAAKGTTYDDNYQNPNA